MAPLRAPIELPRPRTEGRVGLRVIKTSDARALERLLRENRSWLSPWEATHPGGIGVEPGSVSMRPAIRAARSQLRTGAGVPFVITYDSAIVGQLTVSELSGGALRSAQIGYWVAQWVAGRGVTPTAVALTIDYLFEDLGLHRAEICIRPENAASLRVVEKLGMRHEGRRHAYIHIDGAWRDHDSFAITREEIPRGMIERIRRLSD